ncbi:unnamed protein product [Pseudo-nitzschia multistriata]|uniref:Uncharacterized protein n=1 Tax=Pseudo-nitzschia multistriata TaxID=183589 RepID=A0A448Z8C4_9STRA|nr:unnamed protein product [Pseudo-nitzschia multistriata]
MYPFLKLEHPSKSDNSEDGDGQSFPQSHDDYIVSNIVKRLESSTRKVAPFIVRLNELGTFGGKRRGVLWLHPDSGDTVLLNKFDGSNETHRQPSPLIELQQSLEEAFPMCKDQSQKGGFTPHMTLSHFPSLEEALQAKESMESSSNPISSSSGLEFVLDRIYLLERKGDSGQFLRVAEIALGDRCDASNSPSSTANEKNIDSSTQGTALTETKIFDPPQAFPDMPSHEEEWVYQERMAMKSRRRNSRKLGGGRGRQRTPGVPRIPDTPEVIAQKRAERKAKRERLLREQNENEL